MNIQSNYDSTNAPREAAAASRPAAAKAPAGAQPDPAPEAVVADGDTARISSAGASAAAASGSSDVRAEKVAAVQQALAAGTYAVSPSDVAGKLIDHLLRG